MFIKKDIFLECVDLKGKNSMFFGNYLIILLPLESHLVTCSQVYLSPVDLRK